MRGTLGRRNFEVYFREFLLVLYKVRFLLSSLGLGFRVRQSKVLVGKWLANRNVQRYVQLVDGFLWWMLLGGSVRNFILVRHISRGRGKGIILAMKNVCRSLEPDVELHALLGSRLTHKLEH